MSASTQTKPKERDDLAAKLCDGRPGIDPKAVRDELLRIAAELAMQPEPAAVDPETLPELDVSLIIRPERFITSEVSGLAVPTMTTVDGKPAGRFRLYLRWADGKRECRTLPSFIDVADGRRLWIHPSPSEPTANTAAAWSRRRGKHGEGFPLP